MKPIACLTACLCMLFGSGNPIIKSVMAQESISDPVISLTVKDEPLADVLDTIAQQTGYQFNLTPQWEDHPVSATINDLPLEKGLKRLLRSLNHTILWEADKIVTIKVYGKVTPTSSGGISFAAPPQIYREEAEPPAEPDDESLEENDRGMQGDKDGPPESEALSAQESDNAADSQPATTGHRPAVPIIKE